MRSTRGRQARGPDRHRVAHAYRARRDLPRIPAELVHRAAPRAAPGTGTRPPARRSISTVSRYSSRLGPSNHGVCGLSAVTLSPCSALIGIACTTAPPARTRTRRGWRRTPSRSKPTRSILLTARTKCEMPSRLAMRACRLRLRPDAVPGVDEQDGDVGGRGAGRHVARVLLVAGRIGEDELAARGREVAVRDVDRDPLLALGAQAVGEEREVDRPRGAVPRRRFDRAHLILVHRARVVQQPPDERALPVVHAPGRADPKQARHQK